MIMRALFSACVLALLTLSSIQQVMANPCFDINDPQDLCETKETLFKFGEGVLLKQKAAELGTPAEIYAYLRNNADYVPYHGARSNSINTFLGLRGNDVDQSSALIAMLRSQGIRARYVKGDIRITKAELANWLGVINETLAVSMLRDQGTQNIDDSDPAYVVFEHVWVEALVNYSQYRGGLDNARSAACVSQPDECHWVSLSPAFKQKVYKGTYRLLLRNLNFDYDAYYNAQNPSSPSYQSGLVNKSPLEIFEEQALAYLRANHPGLTLEDVIDEGHIIADDTGLLPASLPFEVVGTPARYNSVIDHDAAETVPWTKMVTAEIIVPGCEAINIFPKVSIPTVNLSTQKLTATIFNDGSNVVFGYRMDGNPIGTTLTIGPSATFVCSGFTYTFRSGSLVDLSLSIDVEPGVPPVQVRYSNLVVGGYYLIATGGETSNRTQIQRAYDDLLKANDNNTILVDTTGLLGPVGIPYVDNGNGTLDGLDTPLANDLPAQDALTGGLLYVAQSLYYTRLREESDRYGRLKGIISPISAYIGVVSTQEAVEYLDNVPFAVTPDGLLIDLKGIRLNGSWEIDKPAAYSNETFRFLGHIGSSLEHEVWQEITGYDAISTLRGIQFALGQGKSLLTIRNDGNQDTFPGSLTALGFGGTPPAGFAQQNYTNLFGRNLVAWRYSGSNPTEQFHVIRKDLSGVPAGDTATDLITYSANNGIDGFFSNYDGLENQLTADSASEGQLKTSLVQNSTGSVYQTFDVLSATATSPSGFAVSSFNRTSSTSYQYVVNETAQHADGSYVVQMLASVADSVDQETYSISGLFYNILSISVTSPSGFTVVNFTQPDSTGTMQVTVGESSGHANGSYAINLQIRYFANSSLFTATASGLGPIQIIGNRFVDRSLNLTTAGIDVSDDQTISCTGGPNGEVIDYTGPPSQLLVDLQNCFNNVIQLDNLTRFVDFFDRGRGFDPTAYAYRNTSIGINQYDIDFITTMRSEMYYATNGWFEYLLPSSMPQDTFYLFSVFLKNTYNQKNDLGRSIYAIVNNSNRLISGGGYVSALATINPATSDNFNNTVFTDQNVISVTNNDIIRTPSTVDPVSTVSGNMYHDETDITINGRGLPYNFTRTYNSNRQDQDGPLGFGWSHSYGMALKSNDYGQFPNNAPAKAPENGNSITSSISYTDERGGEHNYVLNADTAGVRSIAVNPPGEFDTLSLNTPSAGLHTLAFRNGAKYVFEGVSNMDTVPNQTARLAYIEDPYDNRLTMGYDTSNRLVSVTDNLGITGRTGLTIAYQGNNTRINTISDWSGRVWDYNYDAQGNLEQRVDPLAQTMQYTYHASTHLLHKLIYPADRGGQRHTTAFRYYENNQTYAYSNTMGETESLFYDLFRKRTRITDPRGGRTEHYYDTNGSLIKMINKDKGILLFNNNADGLRYLKTDGLGFKTQYSFQANRAVNALASNNFGRVSREVDPLNQTTDIDYGLFDQPSTTVDKRSNLVTRTYYQATNTGTGAIRGKLKEVRTTVNGTLNVLLESYTYYTSGQASGQPLLKTEYIDPLDSSRQRITRYIYEPNNGINLRLKAVVGATSGGNVVTTYTYDTLGRLKTKTLRRRTSATDATLLSLTTTYEYDNLDRIIKVTNPRGDIAETVYDKNDKIVEERVQHKQADNTLITRVYSRYTYDAADRRVSSTDILSRTTTFDYDEAGNLVTQTDANGHSTRYEYDAMNRRTAVIDANGHHSEMIYDLGGRLTETKDPNGNVTRFEYDKLGRQTRIISPLGFENRTQYDANGNVTHITDANAVVNPQNRNNRNASIYREYDELNRLTLERDALNGDTVYTYNLIGNLTSITDAEGQKTSFMYDDLGRLVEIIDPLIETSGPDRTDKILQYDRAGNVLLSEDRNGRQRRQTYDTLNRLILTEYLADNTQDLFVYDGFGDLVQTSNAEVGYTYTYTPRHELRTRNDSRLDKTMLQVYDPVGNIRLKIDYQGDITRYQYDSTNRLVALENTAYLQVSYHYDPAGRLLNRILSNGVQTDYTYDADNRLTGLKNVSANKTVVEDLRYLHDEAGNIIHISDNVTGGRTTILGYDALQRLTAFTSVGYPESVRRYSYDKVGNRKTDRRAGGLTYYYCYDLSDCSRPTVGNRLYNIRTGSLTGPLYRQFFYQPDGSVSSKRDEAGNLMYALIYNGKGQVERSLPGYIRYGYDSGEYRIAKGTQWYHLDGKNLESIYSNMGQLQNKYLRGVVVDEIVNSYTYHSTNQNDWTNYTFHHDHLNSVTALTGHTGTIEETTGYDAFGNPSLTLPGTGNDLLYTGREYDRSTGLYYYRARYYDPEIGRFVSEDPLGFKAGVNFYAYVGNNPINNNDPTGLDTQVSIGFTNTPVPGTNHQLVILTDTVTGQKFAVRGGPASQSLLGSASNSGLSTSGGSLSASAGNGGSGGFGFGSIQAEFGAFKPGFRDSPSNVNTIQNVGVIDLDFSDAVSNAIEFTNVTNQNNIPYFPLGPNSNSFASTFVEALTGTRPDPIVNAPGFSLGSPSPNLSFDPSPFTSGSDASAGGGFVLYPNKPNTNTMQQVYSK